MTRFILIYCVYFLLWAFVDVHCVLQRRVIWWTAALRGHLFVLFLFLFFTFFSFHIHIFSSLHSLFFYQYLLFILLSSHINISFSLHFSSLTPLVFLFLVLAPCRSPNYLSFYFNFLSLLSPPLFALQWLMDQIMHNKSNDEHWVNHTP